MQSTMLSSRAISAGRLARRGAAASAAAVLAAVALSGPAVAASPRQRRLVALHADARPRTAQGIIMSDGRSATPLGLLEEAAWPAAVWR